MSSTALAPAAAPPSTALAEQRGFVQLTNLQQAREFADILCKSDLVPKDYVGKAGNAIVAMQMGMEIGLPPLQAIQSIAVVNGRPSLWGDGLRALILSAPDLTDIQETDDGETATCSITRGTRSPVVRTFSMTEAKAAGLAGGNVWGKYPKRMRQNRAFAYAARDAYADRLRGIASAEEQEDVEREPAQKEPKRVAGTVVTSETTPAATGTEPAASETKAPASETPAPSNGGSPEQVTRKAKILSTAYVPAPKGSHRADCWEVGADVGEAKPATFLVAEEGLYRECASCEDTDHRFALTWKLVKRADGSVGKRLLKIDLDDDGGAQ